jgi:subtilisin family serine protease
VAVDRGDCFFSSKVRHIQEAGGVLGIIALLAPGVPFPGGFGEGSPITIPAYMVSKADGDILRNGKAVIRIAPQQGISLAGSVVDTSSRGPEFQSNHIKPELAAPVASVSAEAGTGTGESRFGGTSGATPMVSGAEALLIQGHVSDLNIAPEIAGLDRVARLTPLEVKARLMNTADVSIRNSADSSPPPLAALAVVR